MHEIKELLDLGFEKMVRLGNVIVIEWAEKVCELVRSRNHKSLLLIESRIVGKGDLKKITLY